MHLARRVALCAAGAASLWSVGVVHGVEAPTAAAHTARSTLPTRPRLLAREAILVETDTATTLFAQRANRRVPIASTTKLMTAYVTLEREPLGRVFVDQPYDPAQDESLAGLTVGERYDVADLLRAMLIPSGGDAAHTLAVEVGAGSLTRFVAMMNAAAHTLGLGETHYTTPVGLDTPGNYSTATDLAKLAEDLLRDPFFAKVVREPEAELHDGLVVHNTDDMIGAYPFLVGVKTGHTAQAGYCLVGAASSHGVHLVSVVLGDPSEDARDADTLALLRYGLRLYHSVAFATRGKSYATVGVNGVAGQSVQLVAERSASVVVPRSASLSAQLSGVPPQLEGPLPAGTPAGAIDVSENGVLRDSVPLLTRTAVPAPPAAIAAPLRGAALLGGGGALSGGGGAIVLALGGCTLVPSRARQWARCIRRVAE